MKRKAKEFEDSVIESSIQTAEPMMVEPSKLKAAKEKIQFESNERNKVTKIEDTEIVILDSNQPDRIVYVGKNLSVSQKKKLISLLMENKEIFAYSHDEIPSINLGFICYSLNINNSIKLIRQKRSQFSNEMHEVTDEKVERLLKVGFIQEVDCSDWLSNVV